jgi:predicted site-specific integrase-resolvase
VDRLLNEDEAAEFLGLSPNTLRSWRHTGKGPDFIRMGGCVRYSVPALEAFVNSCTVSAAAEAVTI